MFIKVEVIELIFRIAGNEGMVLCKLNKFRKVNQKGVLKCQFLVIKTISAYLSGHINQLIILTHG